MRMKYVLAVNLIQSMVDYNSFTYPFIELCIEPVAVPTAVHLTDGPPPSIHEGDVGEIDKKVSDG